LLHSTRKESENDKCSRTMKKKMESLSSLNGVVTVGILAFWASVALVLGECWLIISLHCQ
jgi:hypothetical protein